ncbi:MAG: hypothetical protein ACTTIC_07950 [Helicobacteraceae bacterium]
MQNIKSLDLIGKKQNAKTYQEILKTKCSCNLFIFQHQSYSTTDTKVHFSAFIAKQIINVNSKAN